MVSISSVTLRNPASQSLQGAAADAKDKPVSGAAQAVEGVEVKISAAGLAASSAPGAPAKTSQSAQARQIEQLHKMMAELQKQIGEKRAQIDAVANSPLNDEQKAQQVAALNSEVATLSASLTSATATLFTLMRQTSTPALSTDPVSVTAKVGASGDSTATLPD